MGVSDKAFWRWSVSERVSSRSPSSTRLAAVRVAAGWLTPRVGRGLVDAQATVAVDGGQKRELSGLYAEPPVAQELGRIRLEAVGQALEAAAQKERPQIVEYVSDHIILHQQ